jgi:hypothetical protein
MNHLQVKPIRIAELPNSPPDIEMSFFYFISEDLLIVTLPRQAVWSYECA